MAKIKHPEPKKSVRSIEDDLVFWEAHLQKINQVNEETPTEANAVWLENVTLRVQNMRKQIQEPAPVSTKPKF